jgi:acetolactate synthase-1/2/3 large subunit
VALVGGVDEITDTLLGALRVRVANARTPWFREYAPSGPVPQGGLARKGVIHPVAAVRAIESALPDRCRICYDVTSGALHAYEHMRTTTEQRVFSSIEQSACMGEALMASIGVRLASDRPTLVITGDWCQCMSPAEIHTAVERRIGRYVVVVWSNGGGAFIGEGIKQQGYGVENDAWSWDFQPNFALMAEAFGAVGVRVTDAASLEAVVSEGLRGSRPMIVDAAIDPLVPVPAGDRFLTLSQSHG